MPEPVPCRSCGALILFLHTSNGKVMPVDAEPVPDGNVLVHSDGTCRTLKKGETFDPPGTPLHKSHYATCPHAAQHRKPR